MTRKLFLLGGSAAFDVTAKEFVSAAGGPNARIVLLLQGGANWRKNVPDYFQRWIQRGVACHNVIAPDENGNLFSHDVAAKLANAIGVHFTSQNTLPNLLAAMAASRTKKAWGNDDGACVVFQFEQFAQVVGQVAYEIVMTDFENKTYHLSKAHGDENKTSK